MAVGEDDRRLHQLEEAAQPTGPQSRDERHGGHVDGDDATGRPHVPCRVEQRLSHVRSGQPIGRHVQHRGALQPRRVDVASSADAPRSGNIVRSPSGVTSTTIVPVAPPRCTRTSTPAAASSAVRSRPASSSPTRPTNRVGVRPAAKAATFAALPPRQRCTRRRIVGADGEAVGPHDDVLDEVPDHGQHHRHGSGNPERGEGVAPVPWTYVRSRSLVVMFGFVGALLAAGYGALFTMLDDFRDEYGIGESALGAVIGIGFFAGFLAQIAHRPARRPRPRPAARARRHGARHRRAPAAGRVVDGFVPLLVGRFVMGIGVGHGRAGDPPHRHPRRPGAPRPQPRSAARRRRRPVRRRARRVGRCSSGRSASRRRSSSSPRATALALPFVARTAVVETRGAAEPALRVRPAAPSARFAGAVALGCAVWLMIGAFDALWAVVLDDLDTTEWIANLGITPVRPAAGAVRRRSAAASPSASGRSASARSGCCSGPCSCQLYGLVPTGVAMFAVAMVHSVSDGLTVSSTGVAVGIVVPAERQAGAQGVLGGFQTLVAGITAIVAGALYEHAGRTTAYVVSAAAMVVLVALGVILAGADVVLRSPTADVPQVVDGVVDEVAGEGVDGELGAVAPRAAAFPLVPGDAHGTTRPAFGPRPLARRPPPRDPARRSDRRRRSRPGPSWRSGGRPRRASGAGACRTGGTRRGRGRRTRVATSGRGRAARPPRRPASTAGQAGVGSRTPATSSRPNGGRVEPALRARPLEHPGPVLVVGLDGVVVAHRGDGRCRGPGGTDEFGATRRAPGCSTGDLVTVRLEIEARVTVW